MKKFKFPGQETVTRLTWEDFATLLPSDVSKKVAEYASENVTPWIMIGEETGSVKSTTPFFSNLKKDPKAIPPTWQHVSEGTKAALKSKGRITWKDAEKLAVNRSLLFKLFQHGFIKFEEVDDVLLTVPEADVIALNTFYNQLKKNHEGK